MPRLFLLFAASFLALAACASGCAVESVTIDADQSYPDADRSNNAWEAGAPAP